LHSEEKKVNGGFSKKGDRPERGSPKNFGGKKEWGVITYQPDCPFYYGTKIAEKESMNPENLMGGNLKG